MELDTDLYANWREVAVSDEGWRSVLWGLPRETGTEVAGRVVRDLVAKLYGPDPQPWPTEDRDLAWLMQVVSFGLGQSLSTEYETVRDSVKVYSGWLSALTASPLRSLPPPLLAAPVRYAAQILPSLRELFTPRPERSAATIMRQAKEAHAVLRQLQRLAREVRPELAGDLWPQLLRFLLATSHSLLALPFQPDDISVQLCSRVLGVLVELWLEACAGGHFPGPAYWKTFAKLAAQWRHRAPLVDQWTRTTLGLSARVIRDIQGAPPANMVFGEDGPPTAFPESGSSETAKQAWFRFLHLLSCPADLPDRAALVEAWPAFRDACPEGTDPAEHPSLAHLPYTFYRYLAGLSALVDSFLGLPVDAAFPGPEAAIKDWSDVLVPRQPQAKAPLATTVSADPSRSAPERLLKTALGLPAGSVSGRTKEASSTGSSAKGPSSRGTLNPNQLPPGTLVFACLRGRPLGGEEEAEPRGAPAPVGRATEILELVGDWLFSAALARDAPPLHHSHSQLDTMSVKSGGSISESESSTSERSAEQPRSLTNGTSASDLHSVSGIAAGRAEALGALCRIFCAADEALSERHLSRLYACLLAALERKERLGLAAVAFHGAELLRRPRLKGLHILAPQLLDGMEHLLMESQRAPSAVPTHPGLSEPALRKACLRVVGSLLPIPTLFAGQPLVDLNRNTPPSPDAATFLSLRPRLLRTLVFVLCHEQSAENLQIALSLAASFCLELGIWEAAHPKAQPWAGHAVKAVVEAVGSELCKRWAGDYATVVAALDALASLAKLPQGLFRRPEAGDWVRDALGSVCSWLTGKLASDFRHHTRDLHSALNAGFAMLQAWASDVPRRLLVEDESTLRQVTQTLETGILGVRPSAEDKVQRARKPVSARVHDAAEAALHALFPPPTTDPATNLDEEAVLKSLGLPPAKLADFRHFALRTNVLLSFLEVTQLFPEDQGFPSLACLIRSPYHGNALWRFRLRPRDPSTPAPPEVVEAPKGKAIAPEPLVPTRFWPAEVDQAPKVMADDCFPPLVLSPESEALIPKIREAHRLMEEYKRKVTSSGLRPVRPPPPQLTCRVAHVFLQDLGLLDPARIGDESWPLDAGDALRAELRNAVDRCPPRAVLTAHLFFVKEKQRSASDILGNGASLTETSAGFLAFVGRLGSARRLGKDHAAGWTGHWATFAPKDHPRLSDLHEEEDPSPACPFLDGACEGAGLVYSADAVAETAVLLPSPRSLRLRSPSLSSQSSQDTAAAPTPPQPKTPLAAAREDSASGAALSEASDENASSSDEASPPQREGFDCDTREALLSPASCQTLRQRSASHGQLLVSAAETERLRRLAASAKRPSAKDLDDAPAQPPPKEGLYTRRKSTLAAITSVPVRGIRGLGRRMKGKPPLPTSVTTSVFWSPEEPIAQDVAERPLSTNVDSTAPVRPPRSKSVSSSQDLDSKTSGSSRRRATMGSGSGGAVQDVRLLVFWLEGSAELPDLPVLELASSAASTGDEASRHPQVISVGLRPLPSGAVSVSLVARRWGRLGLVGPLVDGAVLSPAAAAVALKETLRNLTRRRAGETEGSQMAQVRRRQRMGEVAAAFRAEGGQADLLAKLIGLSTA